jgi:hypothetical protein
VCVCKRENMVEKERGVREGKKLGNMVEKVKEKRER